MPSQVVDGSELYAGWIEGVRDDGSTWIMWLDAKGNPECFWAKRDKGGGVLGDPIMLVGTPLQDQIPTVESDSEITPLDL